MGEAGIGAWRGTLAALCSGAVVAVACGGCATGRVANLDAYEEVEMNQVIPYPPPEELRKRAWKVVIIDRPAAGIDESLLEKPRLRVRRALEAIAAEAGASVIDPSLGPPGARAGSSGNEGVESGAASGADFALATRFSTWRYQATWKPPFKLPWQSAEDVALKPGTCTHDVSIELDIQLIEIGRGDRVANTFTLKHGAQQKTKDLDPACTIAEVTLDVLFDKALDEALSCVKLPLARRLAPRGHVNAHRKAPAADRHIYRVSLGSAQGLAPGDPVEIRREQRSISRSGVETREERVIARGEVTDQVGRDAAWIAVDPADATEAILEGDVVRPVFEEAGLISSLSGPDCDEILTVR